MQKSVAVVDRFFHYPLCNIGDQEGSLCIRSLRRGQMGLNALLLAREFKLQEEKRQAAAETRAAGGKKKKKKGAAGGGRKRIGGDDECSGEINSNGGAEREHREAQEAWRESSSILDLILEQKRRGDLGLW